ncbi:VanZ family protein [Cupriavidus necator]
MRTDLSRPSHEATALFTPRAKLCLAAAIAFFLTMLVVGSIPGKAQALNREYGDKLMHLCAYACLAGTIFLAFSRYRAVITLASVAILGSLDEIIQGFFPYRSSNLADLLADLMAALAAIAVLSLVNAFISAMARKDAGASYRSPPPSNCAHEDHHHR